MYELAASVDINATTKECRDYVPQILTAHTLSSYDTVTYMWGIGTGTVFKMLKSSYQWNSPAFLVAELPGVMKEATQCSAVCYGLKNTHNDILLDRVMVINDS